MNARRRRRATTDWRSWDNWALFDEMVQPRARHRRWLEIDVAPAEGGPGMAKRLKVPVPEGCGPQVEVKAVTVVSNDPASSASSTLPATGQHVPPAPPNGSQPAVPAVPHTLEYSDYAVQFERFRRGEIAGSYIEAMWGEQTWDLMQAQLEVETS